MDKPLKIGLIARMDRTGLGYQTKALFDLLQPVKTLVVNSTPFKEGYEQIPEWYQTDGINRFVAYTMGMNDDMAFNWFAYDLDVIITCEVPYHDKLYELARARGIKVVLQPNAELNPHFRQKDLDKPDYFFLPSTYYEEETRSLGVPTVVCPPPISLKPAHNPINKEVGHVKVLHIAGKRALADRNGTLLVEDALKDMEGVELVIRDQAKEDLRNQEDMYRGGFHFVMMPRRYGGLCLPMLESLSQGLPVVMPNISPNDGILPPEWLMKVGGHNRIMTKRAINAYQTERAAIRDAVIRFRAMDQRQYDFEREHAHLLYEKHLKALPKWMEYLNKIKEGTL